MADKKVKIEGKEKKKSDEEILFPEVKINDIVIKPWSFGKLFDVSELLEIVIDKAEAKGVTSMFDEGFISYVSMAKIFTLASAQVLSIIAITLDISEEEVRDFNMETGIRIATTIAKQNWGVLKNALAPLFEMLAAGDEENKEPEVAQ